MDWRLMLLSAKPGRRRSDAWTPMLLFALALALLAGVASAKRIYQYTDENGIVHVTDVPPDTDLPVTSRAIKAEPQNFIAVYNTGPRNSFPERFENKLYGPIELEIKFTEQQNIKSTPPLPARFVVEPRYVGNLIELRPVDETQGYRLQISYRAVPGDPNARHDPAAAYLPPVPAGQAFRISQGFNGNRTHTTEDSKYAIDIPMDVGTPVVAARDGIVMDVQDDFYEGGNDRQKYGQRANRVVILHADGTMGIYAHLAPENAQVRPGQTVLAGEVIGRSGNTGYSTGPHLHFVVQRNAGMRIVSVPFYFRDAAGKKSLPETGSVLRGYRPTAL